MYLSVGDADIFIEKVVIAVDGWDYAEDSIMNLKYEALLSWRVDAVLG